MAKILVVDDDAVTAKLIALFLARYQHEVTIVKNGKEALTRLQTDTFDILITDIIMPEMDGYQLLLNLLLHPKRPKVIAMSAGASELDPKQILETSSALKVDATLVKPLTSAELNNTVARLLGGDEPHTAGACKAHGKEEFL